jgi:hypothetical protein
MPTLKFSLFDEDDPTQWKAFETAMARAVLRAFRVAKKEGLIDGYTPPPAEEYLIPDEPHGPPKPEFGLLVEGGNAVPVAEPEQEPEQRQRRQRRKWREVCNEVFSLPDGYVTIEKARDLVGGHELRAQTLIMDWVFAGEVSGVIWCTRKAAPTYGLPGHLMINQPELAARLERREGLNGSAVVFENQRSITDRVAHR